MELRLISAPDSAATPDICNRSRESSKGRLTKHYACWEHGHEVALLSLDIYPRNEFPEVDQLIIYELYVPTALRNRGIGTRVLETAERFGRQLGFPKTMLHAKPLERDGSQEDLIAWYERRGYVMIERNHSKMEKTL